METEARREVTAILQNRSMRVMRAPAESDVRMPHVESAPPAVSVRNTLRCSCTDAGRLTPSSAPPTIATVHGAILSFPVLLSRMAVMEILPAIDLRGGKCVRLRQGDYAQETVFGEDPVAMARKWEAAGGQRLHLVDLDGAKAGKPANVDVIRQIVAAVKIPCQLGGGIRTAETVWAMLADVGLDRVIIGTQALKQPAWFREIVEKFPGRICLGLDARNSMVATEGWRNVSQTPALELARQYVGLPLAAVIYTNIANDGMMQGIDEATLADYRSLARLGLKVIASGGVTTLEDIRKLHEISTAEPNLIGVITGRAIYEGTVDVAQAVRVANA